ncbi:TetR/AcrR family transcriptional regulator [Parafrigoribacterium soli]|uniref:TetR/AcrR family transcriptional regulator n=1 Tax=Parafrigoribacterium soli TaxID=3144663 RepID=UPI0032EE64D8
MVAHHVVDALPAGATLLRNEPVQARSTARLTALLDAAASVIGEIGYERLTTAMVAERAGASIGTVYRYFPDRIAVLQSLSARNLNEFTSRGLAGASDSAVTGWARAVEAAVDGIAAFFRDEPGFKSLRFGDVLDVRPRAQGSTGNGTVASQLAAILSDRFDLKDDAQLRFRVEVALELADALLARAFAFGDGDKKFIDEARKVAVDYLAGYYSR